MGGRSAARLLVLAVLWAAASGCAVVDTGAFGRLQEEVEGLKRDVAAAKAAPPPAAPAPAPARVPASRVESDDLSSVRRSLADLSAENAQIKSDLLAASTRSEEAKVALQKEVSRLNSSTEELSQGLSAVRAKAGRIDDAERRIAAVEERVAKLSGAQAPHSVPQAPSAGQEWKTPEEMYDYALGLIKGGENRKGREVLGAFAAKYPDHRLLQNVYYWKGESYYAEKDFESAILAFQDVIDKYPAGDKAPDAMLKQGLSFQAMKDGKSARSVLEILVSKFPKTPAAEKARQKLAELK